MTSPHTGGDEGAPTPPGAGIVDRLKAAVNTADGATVDVLVARANSPAAMKVVALLALEAAEHQFASAKSRRNWTTAVAAIESAHGIVVGCLQAHMGPAAAAIFLAKLAAAVCRGNHLPRAKMLRLCRHFLADPHGEGHLPLDQVLELGAQLSDPHQGDA